MKEIEMGPKTKKKPKGTKRKILKRILKHTVSLVGNGVLQKPVEESKSQLNAASSDFLRAIAYQILERASQMQTSAAVGKDKKILSESLSGSKKIAKNSKKKNSRKH